MFGHNQRNIRILLVLFILGVLYLDVVVVLSIGFVCLIPYSLLFSSRFLKREIIPSFDFNLRVLEVYRMVTTLLVSKFSLLTVFQVLSSFRVLILRIRETGGSNSICIEWNPKRHFYP